MKSLPPRIEMPRAQKATGSAFAVLIAGLSARQAASATAQHQMSLKRDHPVRPPCPEVELLDECKSLSAGQKGSFSAGVARAISGEIGS